MRVCEREGCNNPVAIPKVQRGNLPRFCCAECRIQAYYENRKALKAKHAAKADKMLRAEVKNNPLVARALALSRFPYLRTPEEQEALDNWLNEHIKLLLLGYSRREFP